MLKKMQKNMGKYMNNTKTLSNVSSTWQEQCYTFGYLDGYFDEQIYIEYIIESNDNESKLEVYNTGYEKGLKDRTKIRYNNPEVLKKDTIEWVKKLALHDVLNNVETRNLKEKNKELYQKYQNGTFHLGKMDFIEEHRISKKR